MIYKTLCVAFAVLMAVVDAGADRIGKGQKVTDANGTASAYQYKEAAGPYGVEIKYYDWVDAARKWEVPVKVYYPAKGKGPWPVVIFSHGLGGSRDGYEYLGRQWASWGYVSVHVQHKGSDTEVWKGKTDAMAEMRKAAMNPQNAVNRCKDVQFVIDELAKLNGEDGIFKGRLDMDHIGVAGHSFGAHTTLAIAGQGTGGRLGGLLHLSDPRVKAAIPMSAPVVAIDKARAYGNIKIPCLHMTGTLDNSPIGDTTAAQRRIPFDSINGADGYLVTFTGGDHMIFSGRPGLNRDKDGEFQRLIRISTTAFWDAYLLGDMKAKAWLADDGFEKVLGSEGKFEKKVKAAGQK